MADDSFFREVNEDVRSERLRSFWSRFGWMIITAVIVIIAATAAWGGYTYWRTQQASQAGDAFLEALTHAREGRTEEALAALSALEADGFGSYPVLARMRAATLKAEAGDVDAAVADFRAIGDDTSVPIAIREAARIRAAYLLVDHGSYDDVVAVVNDLAENDDHAMRHSAREALGLAAWRAEDIETAQGWFDRIASDGQATPASAERAEIMLEVIAAYDPDASTAPPSQPPAAPPAAPLSLEDLAPGLMPGNAPDAASDEPANDAIAPAEGNGELNTAPETVPLESLEAEDPS
jgi:hypothetical protein